MLARLSRAGNSGYGFHPDIGVISRAIVLLTQKLAYFMDVLRIRYRESIVVVSFQVELAFCIALVITIQPVDGELGLRASMP